MSPMFVQEFKRLNKCPACSEEKHAGYSLCLRHLAAARLQFQAWSRKRRRLGLCCYCDCKSFRGWLRCRRHREINRLRCMEWIKAHPEHYKEAWAKKKRLQAAGFCPYCREHRPLAEGFSRCDACRLKHAKQARVRK